jgi:flagellar biosynthesis/type III secretory pathway protein FliH
MAHLKAQETRGKGEERKRWKWSLTRRLFERGYAREDVLNLLRFIDWVMRLPQELEESFWQEVEQYEEERRMRYVTSIERIGMKKGREQGLQQGLQQGLLQGARESVLVVLEARFGRAPQSVAKVIDGMEDPFLLKTLLQRATTLGSLEEFERTLYGQA